MNSECRLLIAYVRLDKRFADPAGSLDLLFPFDQFRLILNTQYD